MNYTCYLCNENITERTVFVPSACGINKKHFVHPACAVQSMEYSTRTARIQPNLKGNPEKLYSHCGICSRRFNSLSAFPKSYLGTEKYEIVSLPNTETKTMESAMRLSYGQAISRDIERQGAVLSKKTRRNSEEVVLPTIVFKRESPNKGAWKLLTHEANKKEENTLSCLSNYGDMTTQFATTTSSSVDATKKLSTIKELPNDTSRTTETEEVDISKKIWLSSNLITNDFNRNEIVNAHALSIEHLPCKVIRLTDKPFTFIVSPEQLNASTQVNVLFRKISYTRQMVLKMFSNSRAMTHTFEQHIYEEDKYLSLRAVFMLDVSVCSTCQKLHPFESFRSDNNEEQITCVHRVKLTQKFGKKKHKGKYKDQVSNNIKVARVLDDNHRACEKSRAYDDAVKKICVPLEEIQVYIELSLNLYRRGGENDTKNDMKRTQNVRAIPWRAAVVGKQTFQKYINDEKLRMNLKNNPASFEDILVSRSSNFREDNCEQSTTINASETAGEIGGETKRFKHVDGVSCVSARMTVKQLLEDGLCVIAIAAMPNKQAQPTLEQATSVEKRENESVPDNIDREAATHVCNTKQFALWHTFPKQFPSPSVSYDQPVETFSKPQLSYDTREYKKLSSPLNSLDENSKRTFLLENNEDESGVDKKLVKRNEWQVSVFHSGIQIYNSDDEIRLINYHRLRSWFQHHLPDYKTWIYGWIHDGTKPNHIGVPSTSRTNEHLQLFAKKRYLQRVRFH